jgi:drug/metabolite transporter (DMT)-like permease
MLGVMLRITSATLFACMSAVVQVASTRGASMPELIFYRSAFALPVVAAWVTFGPGWGAVRTQRPLAHLTRGAIGLTSMLLTFGALALLPLGEATTLSYAAPIVATILAAIVLREAIGWHRWAAVLIGFVGVILVIRPGHAHGLPPFGIAVGVASAFVLGGVMITLRQIGQYEHTAAIVFWFTSLCTLFGAAMLPFFGKHHDPATFGFLILSGLIGGGSQLTMTASLRFASVATVVPFDYVQILWATLFGWLVFGSAPLATTLLGAALIAGSGIYTAYRERMKGKIPPQVFAPPES